MCELDQIPTFQLQPDKAKERLSQLAEQGYRPIINILGAGQLTVRQLVLLHERGSETIRLGALIGPCILEGEIMAGISLYVIEERV